MRTWVTGSFLTLALVTLSGCGGGSEQPHGDCGPSVRFHGVVYVADSRVTSPQSTGRFVGPGALLDCDHRTVVDHVTVSALTDVAMRQAIAVRQGTWRGVYVAEDLPRREWPAVLTAR